MDEPNDPVTPARMRTLKIIVFAQTMGLAIFAGVVASIVHNRGAAGGGGGVFSPLAAAMLAVLGTASFLMPQFVRRQNVGRIARGEWQAPPGQASAYETDGSKLFAVYLTTLIIGLALVEGAGFFCCIAYLVEGQPYVLGLIALALALQIGRFPTVGRVRAWMEQQLDRLAQERQGAGPA